MGKIIDFDAGRRDAGLYGAPVDATEIADTSHSTVGRFVLIDNNQDQPGG